MRAALFCLALCATSAMAQDDGGEPFLALDDDVAEALGLSEEPEEVVIVDTTRAEPSDPTSADILAECAAMLAVASTTSSSFVERDRLRDGASMWFATAGDVAIEEGNEPDTASWAAAVERWTPRIGSVSALPSNAEWAQSCIELGSSRALDTSAFAGGAIPASEETATTDETSSGSGDG